MTVKLRLAVAALLLFLVGDGGFHQQNHVGAGGWGAGLRHCGIAVAGDKRNSLHNA